MTKSDPKKPKGEKRESIASMRFEKLRAHYIATGEITEGGRIAGYSEKYVRTFYHKLRERLEADPMVREMRQTIQETAIASAKEKREFLWKLAQQAAQEVPVKDHEGNETGEYKFDGRTAVEAVRELNRMDGDLAEVQIKHKGKVAHSFDPENMSDDEINAGLAEFAELIGKGQACRTTEGKEKAG